MPNDIQGAGQGTLQPFAGAGAGINTEAAVREKERMQALAQNAFSNGYKQVADIGMQSAQQQLAEVQIAKGQSDLVNDAQRQVLQGVAIEQAKGAEAERQATAGMRAALTRAELDRKTKEAIAPGLQKNVDIGVAKGFIDPSGNLAISSDPAIAEADFQIEKKKGDLSGGAAWDDSLLTPEAESRLKGERADIEINKLKDIYAINAVPVGNGPGTQTEAERQARISEIEAGAAAHSKQLDNLEEIRRLSIGRQALVNQGPVTIAPSDPNFAPMLDELITKNTFQSLQTTTDIKEGPARAEAQKAAAQKAIPVVQNSYTLEEKNLQIGESYINGYQEAKKMAAASGNERGMLAKADMQLINALMKMADPGSVVRESEYERFKNFRSVGDQIKAKYNNLKTGAVLLPEERAEWSQLLESMKRGHEINLAKKAVDIWNRYSQMPGATPGATLAEDILGPYVSRFNLKDPSSPWHYVTSATPGSPVPDKLVKAGVQPGLVVKNYDPYTGQFDLDYPQNIKSGTAAPGVDLESPEPAKGGGTLFRWF